MNEFNHYDDSDISIGETLYLIEDLSNPVILYDILSTVYTNHSFLYYLEDDDRPYKRIELYNKAERRRIIINKLLDKKKITI